MRAIISHTHISLALILSLSCYHLAISLRLAEMIECGKKLIHYEIYAQRHTHTAIRIINDVYVNDVKKLLSHVYGSNKMMLHTRAPNSITKIRIYFYVQVDVDARVLISHAHSLSHSPSLSLAPSLSISVTSFDSFVAHLHIGLNESSTEMQMRQLESLIQIYTLHEMNFI